MTVDEIALPVQIRLRAIEVLLNHYGYVNRNMLCDFFGLGSACVSRDIAMYNKLNDGVSFYNQSTRRIEKLSNFKAIFK